MRHRRFSKHKQKIYPVNKTIKKRILSPRIKKYYTIKGGTLTEEEEAAVRLRAEQLPPPDWLNCKDCGGGGDCLFHSVLGPRHDVSDMIELRNKAADEKHEEDVDKKTAWKSKTPGLDQKFWPITPDDLRSVAQVSEKKIIVAEPNPVFISGEDDQAPYYSYMLYSPGKEAELIDEETAKKKASDATVIRLYRDHYTYCTIKSALELGMDVSEEAGARWGMDTSEEEEDEAAIKWGLSSDEDEAAMWGLSSDEEEEKEEDSSMFTVITKPMTGLLKWTGFFTYKDIKDATSTVIAAVKSKITGDLQSDLAKSKLYKVEVALDVDVATDAEEDEASEEDEAEKVDTAEINDFFTSLSVKLDLTPRDKQDIYRDLDGNKVNIVKLLTIFNNITPTTAIINYPSIATWKDFILYFDNYRIMYKYTEMAAEWLNLLNVPQFYQQGTGGCSASGRAIMTKESVIYIQRVYSLHLALILYMLKIPYLKYIEADAIDYLNSDNVAKGYGMKYILCDIIAGADAGGEPIFNTLFTYVERLFANKFDNDTRITRGMLTVSGFTEISKDSEMLEDKKHDLFRAYVMSNGNVELTRQFINSSQTKYSSIINASSTDVVPLTPESIAAAKMVAQNYKRGFTSYRESNVDMPDAPQTSPPLTPATAPGGFIKWLGFGGGDYPSSNIKLNLPDDSLRSVNFSQHGGDYVNGGKYTLTNANTTLNIIGKYAFDTKDFQNDSAHDDTTLRTKNEDSDFKTGIDWTCRNTGINSGNIDDNFKKLLSSCGSFYLLERGTGIVDITDNGDFAIPEGLPRWRYVIDAGGWKKAFPIFKNACDNTETTYNLSNLTDPASTGSGQFYICYEKLAEAAKNSEPPWNADVDEDDKAKKAQIGATIFIRLLVEFMRSIINDSKQVDEELERIGDRVNKIWSFLLDEVYVVGTQGDNIMFSSFSGPDDKRFSWEGKQPNMARYIIFYSKFSTGGKLISSTRGAKARGLDKGDDDPKGTSGMVDAFIEYIKDESEADKSTLIVLFCRILKYAGDKSHIVCAILLMFLNTNPEPYIILTLDRLLGKAIIQAIEFSKYVGNATEATWGSDKPTDDENIRDMLKTIGENLGVSLAANGEVHSLLKSLDSYKDLQAYQNSENRYGEVFLYKSPDNPIVAKCNKFLEAYKAIEEADKIVKDDRDIYTPAEGTQAFKTAKKDTTQMAAAKAAEQAILQYLDPAEKEAITPPSVLDNYPNIILAAQKVVLHRESQIQEYKEKIINDRILDELEKKYVEHIPPGRPGRKSQNYINVSNLRNQFPFTMKRGSVRTTTHITISYDESLKQFYKIVFVYNQQKTNTNYPTNPDCKLNEEQQTLIKTTCDIINNYYTAIVENWIEEGKDNISPPDMREIAEYIVDLGFMDSKTGISKYKEEGWNITMLKAVDNYSEDSQQKRVISNIESYITDVMSILKETSKAVSIPPVSVSDVDGSRLRTPSAKRSSSEALDASKAPKSIQKKARIPS